MNTQQGSGALLMAILLLLMSTALLNATRQQLDASLSLVADERLYLRQASLAASALEAGKREKWASTVVWRCLTVRQQPDWRACFKVTTKGEALLRGDGGKDTIAFYQWVTHDEQNGRVHPQPHGWLDFCPLAQEEDCLPDRETAGL